MNDLLQLKKPPLVVTQKNTEMEPQSMTIKCKSNNNHKRPSLTCEISSKRIKGQQDATPMTSPPTSPQLLQQLMTHESGSHQNTKVMKSSAASTQAGTSQRWQSSSSSSLSNTKQHSQPSNSVLMNLLVSGCDVSAGYYTCFPRPKVAKA